MGRRKSKDFDDDEVGDYFDSFSYDEEEDEEEPGLDLDSISDDEEYEPSPILDEVSISDIVNEHGIDELAEAIIDSLSDTHIERLRDKLNEYLE